MKKNLFLSIRIEHILFTLALISISSTIFFKYRESSKFQALLEKLEYTKQNTAEIITWDENTKNSFFSDLRITF